MNAGVVRGEWTSCSQLNWHINKYARGHLMNLLCDDGIMSEEASVYSFVFATCSYHIFMHSTSMIQTMPSKGNLDTIQSTWWRACTRFRPHHTTCCLHLAARWFGAYTSIGKTVEIIIIFIHCPFVNYMTSFFLSLPLFFSHTFRLPNSPIRIHKSHNQVMVPLPASVDSYTLRTKHCVSSSVRIFSRILAPARSTIVPSGKMYADESKATTWKLYECIWMPEVLPVCFN